MDTDIRVDGDWSPGGRTIELAWRSAATAVALKAIIEAVPEMMTGGGTLLAPEQIVEAAQLGAIFGMSSGLHPAVATTARQRRLPFAPGIQPPSELQLAVALGCQFLKFFPVATASGVPHLSSLHAPFAHLGLEYLPLGGIDERSVVSYLEESWVLPPATSAPGARGRSP